MSEDTFKVTLHFDDEDAYRQFREQLYKWRHREEHLDRARCAHDTAKRVLEAGRAAAKALSCAASFDDDEGEEIDSEEPPCGCCWHYQSLECWRGECDDGSKCVTCDPETYDDEDDDEDDDDDENDDEEE